MNIISENVYEYLNRLYEIQQIKDLKSKIFLFSFCFILPLFHVSD